MQNWRLLALIAVSGACGPCLRLLAGASLNTYVDVNFNAFPDVSGGQSGIDSVNVFESWYIGPPDERLSYQYFEGYANAQATFGSLSGGVSVGGDFYGSTHGTSSASFVDLLIVDHGGWTGASGYLDVLPEGSCYGDCSIEVTVGSLTLNSGGAFPIIFGEPFPFSISVQAQAGFDNGRIIDYAVRSDYDFNLTSLAIEGPSGEIPQFVRMTSESGTKYPLAYTVAVPEPAGEWLVALPLMLLFAVFRTMARRRRS